MHLFRYAQCRFFEELENQWGQKQKKKTGGHTTPWRKCSATWSFQLFAEDEPQRGCSDFSSWPPFHQVSYERGLHMSAQPIETQRLDIVPLDPHRDAARLHTIRSQYEVWSNMGQNEPSSVPNPDGMRSEMEKNGGWNWVIRLKETQEVIGSVSLNPGGAIRGMAWYLDPVYWGQGLMSEAVSSVVENLLGTRTFHGLEAWINSDNRPSIAVARNAGMTERGRMPIYYKTREMPHQNVVIDRKSVV